MALVQSYAENGMSGPGSRLSQMKARFQQRQLHEKEQKMLAMLETQQQRTIQRVGRGSAGSTGSTSSSVSSNGGRVRQLLEEKRSNAQNNNGNVGKARSSGTKGSPVGWDKSYPLDPIDRSWGGPRGGRHGGMTVSHANNNRGVSLDRSAAAAAQKTTIRRTRSHHQVQNPEEDSVTNGNYHPYTNGRRNGASHQKTPVSVRHSIATVDANANRYAFEDEDGVDDADELSASTRSLSKRLANVGLRNKNEIVETNGVAFDPSTRPNVEELKLENEQRSLEVEEVDFTNGEPESPPPAQPFNHHWEADIPEVQPVVVEPVPPPRRRESQPRKKAVPENKPPVTRRTSRPNPIPARQAPAPVANTSRSSPESPTSPPPVKSPPEEMFIPVSQGKGRGRPPPERLSPSGRGKTSSDAASPSQRVREQASSNVSVPGRSQARERTVASAPAGDLVGCPICGRNFATDRISTHKNICAKTTKKKRKVFDPMMHRVKGTEAEAYVRKALKNPPPPPNQKGNQAAQRRKSSNAPTVVSSKSSPAVSDAQPPSNWRKKHEEFIRTIREAKKVQQYLASGGKLSDLPPPVPSENLDYIQCPHCNRRFNESAAERHIPRCKDILSNKRGPPSKATTSKRR